LDLKVLVFGFKRSSFESQSNKKTLNAIQSLFGNFFKLVNPSSKVGPFKENNFVLKKLRHQRREIIFLNVVSSMSSLGHF